jgi:CHASE3 domain sensor protein
MAAHIARPNEIGEKMVRENERLGLLQHLADAQTAQRGVLLTGNTT